MKKKKSMKPPSASVAINSRAIVGPGERSLLPGHVRELGYHGGLQGDQSNIAGPVDDLPPSATT